MLTRIETGSKLSVLWKFNDHAGDYSIGFSVCEDPFCSCRDMTLSFIGVGSQPDTSTYFNINLKRRELLHGDRMNVFGRFFARHVLGEFQDPDWSMLEEVYRSLKMEQTATYDPLTGLVPKFDIQAIERRSEMVFYPDIFPWAGQLHFTVGTTVYVIENGYCLKPGCPCQSACLVFLPFIEKKQVKLPLCPSLMYEYLTCQWSSETGWSGLGISPTVFIGKMAEQLPDINRTLTEQHQRLKTMYKRYRDKHPGRKKKVLPPPGAPIPIFQNTKPAIPWPTTGRNDPCPCGSGKKYKKCCG